MEPTVLRLRPFVQKYPWGRPKRESLVAAVAAATHASASNFDRKLPLEPCASATQAPAELGQGCSDLEEPFAELWMGSHPNGTNYVLPIEPEAFLSGAERSTETLCAGPGESLAEFLCRQPSALCKSNTTPNASSDRSIKTAVSGNSSLPFLLKVLSVGAPLSLQSHPDKGLASKLHATRPQQFPDPNHKPEMAIAVGPFWALAGFRPPQEVAAFAVQIPEFLQALGEDFISSADGKAFIFLGEQLRKNEPQYFQRDASKLLHLAYSSLMLVDNASCSHADLNFRRQKQQEALVALKKRLSSNEQTLFDLQRLQGSAEYTLSQQQIEAECVARLLLDKYPEDPGVFAAFFLNLVYLKDGEALFIPPNLLHCYLSGNCVEVMGASDNVIRGGLTSKPTDAELLVRSLNFEVLGSCELSERCGERPQHHVERDRQRRLCRVEPVPLPDDHELQRLLLDSLAVGETRTMKQHRQVGKVEYSAEGTLLYAPPMDGFGDFCVARIQLSRGTKRALNLTCSSAGILLVLSCPFPAALVVNECSETKPQILRLQAADIFFIAAGSCLTIDTDQHNAIVEEDVNCRTGETQRLAEMLEKGPGSRFFLAFLVTGASSATGSTSAARHWQSIVCDNIRLPF